MKKWFIVIGIVVVFFIGGYLGLSFYGVKLIQPQLQKLLGPGFTLTEINVKLTHLSIKGIQYEGLHTKKRYLWIEEAKIDRLTVFEFSPEEGTSAANLPDQIPESESESRMYRIMEAQFDISLEINETWIGKEIEVLLEGFSDDGRLVGRSYRDAPDIDGLIFVKGVPDEIESGEIVRAIVTSALPYDLEAEFKR